jgi:hypothetical protein
VCIARTSTTWPRIERVGRFAVNILGEHQEELSRLFSTPGADRFGAVQWHPSAGGSPVLHEVLAYLDCEIWASYDGGDHIIVVARVLDLGITHDAGPLVFYQGAYARITSGLARAVDQDPTADPGISTLVVGTDAAAVGAAIAELRARGGRAAGFVGDPARERDALVEMLAELFAAPESSDRS